MVYGDSAVGLLMMCVKEMFSKEIGREKARKLEWQVISPSTADQAPLSVEMHSMRQTHLSLPLPFFSFSIFSDIF